MTVGLVTRSFKRNDMRIHSHSTTVVVRCGVTNYCSQNTSLYSEYAALSLVGGKLTSFLSLLRFHPSIRGKIQILVIGTLEPTSSHLRIGLRMRASSLPLLGLLCSSNTVLGFIHPQGCSSSSPPSILFPHRARRKISDSSVEQVDKTTETMSQVANAVSRAAPQVINGLRTQGWAVVDGFLSCPELSSAMRKEAETYFESGEMTLGQSTRFDPTTQSVVTYNKHNVFSMQLMGGETYYLGR